MLPKNKFSKYLIYAIGEIFLVVIGILIALQINNWNSEKKARVEEKQLLQNLKFDFNNAIEDLTFLLDVRNQQVSAIKKLYTILESGHTNYTEDELLKLLWLESFTGSYDSQSSALNMLSNSGKINIISNDLLTNKLISWPDMLADFTEEEDAIREMTQRFYLPITGKHVSLAQILRSRKDIFDYGMVIPNGTIKNDFSGLFKNTDFENLMTYKLTHIILAMEGSETLITTAKGIVETIDNELKK